MATEPTQITQNSHAKWDVAQHVLFVRLCEDEVHKGNRPTGTLSKQGWDNVGDVFNPRFNLNYQCKQFKNHWDSMKTDCKLFIKLKCGHTGIGWNESTKSFNASDEWWDARIQVSGTTRSLLYLYFSVDDFKM